MRDEEPCVVKCSGAGYHDWRGWNSPRGKGFSRDARY